MVEISVIVPVYNGEKEILRLLAALELQTQAPETVEYIIVDNNSTDRTKELIRSYIENTTLNLRRIEENDIQGSYAARNKGIRAAKGTILIFTDADCIPHPDWIKNILPAFQDRRTGAIAGKIDSYPAETLLEEFAVRRKVLSQDYTLNHEFMPFGQTANIAFRRDVFSKIGLFRSGLKTAGDADLCWRMQKETDFTIAYATDALVLHKHRTNFRALHEQFERYGRSVVYLRQLYGWSMAREPRLIWYIRKFAAWALLGYPVLEIRYLMKRISKIEVYEEPIRIFIKYCTYSGRKNAERAGPLSNLEIEYLDKLSRIFQSSCRA